jgi:hypothetical protein
MINLRSLIIGGMTVLAGCQTMATGTDVAARITNPSTASQAALQHAVNDALNTEVLLAADALTTSSILVIERNPPRSMQSQPATGRIMDPPIRFHLVLNNSECILVDQRDESRRLLEDTTCAAE